MGSIFVFWEKRAVERRVEWRGKMKVEKKRKKSEKSKSQRLEIGRDKNSVEKLAYFLYFETCRRLLEIFAHSRYFLIFENLRILSRKVVVLRCRVKYQFFPIRAIYATPFIILL